MNIQSNTRSENLSLEQALDFALEQHGNGNLFQAKNLYQQILKAEPSQPDALHLLGVISFQEGKSKIAIEHIKKALSIKPNFAEAHSNLGNILRETGQYKDAILHLQKAISINRDFADAHNNLGASLHALKRFDDAAKSYKTAFTIKPDFAEAHYNFGNVMRAIGNVEEVIIHYKKALSASPDYAEAHYALGNVMRDMGKLDEAVTHYERTLTLLPDYVEALNVLGATQLAQGRLEKALSCFKKIKEVDAEFPVAFNLGTTLQGLGRFDEAISSYRLANSPNARAKSLECLYALERYDEFYLGLEELSLTDKTNIRAAAISAFASHQLNRADPYPFCPQPMDFVRMYEGLGKKTKSTKFNQQLVDFLKTKTMAWEPAGNTTKKGFQSPSTLFIQPNQLLSDLEQIIRVQIEAYCSEFCGAGCQFIKLMPRKFSLRGWVVCLLKGGHQAEHIHTDGWISGVYYLQVPELEGEEEGCIEFGLWGYDYPIVDNNYPRKRFVPQNSDLVLFPSSLFHRTIPFQATEERMCIAFDVVPG
ncbi:MAG: Lipopolysaccharide assembly protein B [Alphaproteobacteria bacterium MarineAlpha3_Bin5]|nr:hypothetical protein [Magnetovibrio sp.]PPR78680.1 MAG: Lipopolysaccharide assembly protein B [Alphaproteobacteria bacterium MarineAlpha3_Bin5]